MTITKPPFNPLILQIVSPAAGGAVRLQPMSSPMSAQPVDATIVLQSSLSVPTCDFVVCPDPQHYVARYSIDRIPFSVTVRSAARVALEKAEKDGAHHVAIDLPDESSKAAVDQVLKAIQDYVDRVGHVASGSSIEDITLRTGQSAISVWEHRFHSPEEWLRPQRINVDSTKGEVFPNFDVDDPPDVTVVFENQRHAPKQEAVHLVSTGGLFRNLVTWKMGFSIFYQEDRLYIYLTKWQHPDKYSPHDIIAQGRAMLINHFGEHTCGLFFEKGYITPSDRQGVYVISDLGGSAFHRDRGMQETPGLQGTLTEKARILQAIFASRYGVEVEFEDPNPPCQTVGRSYGPR
jgi:hypothetical protein